MVKGCAWGTCKSDSRYAERLFRKPEGTQITFHHFSSEEKRKERREVWIRTLIIYDMEIVYAFASLYNLVNDFGYSPPFGLYDIFNYLINHFANYDKQGLAAYKSYDRYR